MKRSNWSCVPRPSTLLWGCFLFSGLCVPISGCRDGSSSSSTPTDSVIGRVVDGAGDPVVGATVYLIPSSSVDLGPLTTEAVLSGAAEEFDEPLEDLIRKEGRRFPRGETGLDGDYRVDSVPEEAYFFYVEPSEEDASHLPGGDVCREVFELREIAGGRSNLIRVSGVPSPDSGYVGSTACLACHPDDLAQYSTLHRLGFRDPAGDRGLQDSVRFPEFIEGMEFLFNRGQTVYYYDFDGSRGIDKYATSLDFPPPGSDVSVSATFFKRDEVPWIRLENLANPGDPRSGSEFKVELVYGGGLYKERYLVRVGNSHYPSMIQYQSQGSEGSNDRTRGRFRDYHGDHFYDEATKTIKEPPLNSAMEIACLSCHATGYSVRRDETTGEWIGDAVDDENGVFDIDGDGTMDEINVGCEVCHGPGAEHVAAARGVAIVQPDFLPPGRSNVLCGQCHSRPQGNGTLLSGAPLDSQNRMMRAGTSRAQYLREHTTRPDAALGNLWEDGLHSKSHRQQYTDHLKSAHYRNRRWMLTCWDCHQAHGDTPHPRELLEDPRSDALCFRCHAIDPLPHMKQETGSIHIGESTRCAECHMPRTAKTGAGRKGFILDSSTNYWENDITGHLMVVPRKTNPGVSGKRPGDAMPAPYTLRCGQACHVVDTLGK